MDRSMVKTIDKDEECLRQISTLIDNNDKELKNYIKILKGIFAIDNIKEVLDFLKLFP